MKEYELEQLILKYYRLVCDIDTIESEEPCILPKKLPKGDEIRAKLEALLKLQKQQSTYIPGSEYG